MRSITGVVAAPAGAVAVGLLCAALACASGAPRRQGTAWLPALAPGQGRLVLYRVNDTEATLFHPKLTVDGEPVGHLTVGSFLYVDRSPGVHEIHVKKQPNVSAFGGQAPTQPVVIQLAPAETVYVQFSVNATPVWIESSLARMDPIHAQRDLAKLTEAAPTSGD